MHQGFTHNPALTIAVALAVGVLAQAIARHLKVPGIVLLLASGVVLGPDVFAIVDPGDLGPALGDLIGFAVAVILFDGGLNLNLKRMRSQALPIRLLLSVGVVITSLGGALAVRLVLGWDWTTSLLFGTLVIVTGPTVITPLLRRIRVRRSIETILESEGVLIDAVGAVVAVVALEVALAPRGEAAHLLAGAPAGLFGGLAIGAAGGALLALLLRSRRIVPEGFGNILTLGVVLTLFQASNALIPESGIAAAIAAGFVVGNLHPAARELREFKEQLTTMLIGLLFVLLAADVRVADVWALGGSGLAVVALLMFVVRPLSVAACTSRSQLTLPEKGFLAWVAPRGIVAAAVATLFNDRLSAAGVDGGGELRALVFLVIASTVLFQGATAGLMARLLGVRRPMGQGYAILGSQALGRLLGTMLQGSGSKVVMMDADPLACREAEQAGLRVVFGNVLEDRVLMRAAVDSRRAVVAASTSESINLLLTQKVLHEYKGPAVMTGVQSGNGGVEPPMVRDEGATVLFTNEIDLELWNVRVRRGTATTEAWKCERSEGPVPEEMLAFAVPFVRELKDRLEPVHDGSMPGKDALVHWLISIDKIDEAHTRLRDFGWIPPGGFSMTRRLAVVLIMLAIAVQAAAADRVTGRSFATRSEVIARHGMAATSQPLATQIALDVLKAGGSAVDAAIAANAALGLMEPTGNGIGGDLFAIVWDPETKRLHGLNASGRSPQTLTLDEFERRGLEYVPPYGVLPISVPGCVDGWFELHGKFGRLPMNEVLAPAVRYAGEGFPVSELIAYYWGISVASRAEHPFFLETFTVDGRAPRKGEVWRNPMLAKTLERIGAEGRDVFYRGDLARTIAKTVQDAGGFLSYDDLASHSSEWVEPVSTTYRGVELWELPPNGQGIAALQILNILEGYDIAAMGFGSADYIHHFTEAKKLAFEDRAKFYADPDFSDVPVDGLISKAYADERRALIDPARAARRYDHGNPALYGGDTIYLTVADADGMMVSLIQSNYRGMGSGVCPEGLGFCLQDRGELFTLTPGEANTYEPGKRPFHTIIPAFLTRDGEPWVSFGVMGGATQPQAHAQIVINLVDFGMNLQEAGDAPRILHSNSSQPTGEVMSDGGVLSLETGPGWEVLRDLRNRGHRIQIEVGPFGGYQAIMFEASQGVYYGASESRKDGQAGGY